MMPPRIIHEGDPMPKQPDAEPRFTMSGMGISMRGVVGGVEIAFEEHVDATADADFVNERVDFLSTAIGRFKAKTDLVEKLIALQANAEMLAQIPQEQEAALKKLERDKAAHLLGLQAAFQARGKRGDFQLSATEETNLQKYDAQREPIIRGFADRKADLDRDRPVIEQQIRRLRAIIDGADPTEEPLSQAAE